MRNSSWTRTSQLAWLDFKRDWLKILLWIIVLVGMLTAVAMKFTGVYSTKAAIASIVTTLKSPAMVSIFGAFTAKQPYTLADVFATEMVIFMAIGMAIFNISLAVSHSRGDEDAGITELVRSHAVGRLAPLMGGLLELVIVNLGVGVLFGGGLQLANLTGSNTNGNWLIAAGLASSGLMMGTLSLVVAQLVNNASAATMGSYLVFGLMYLARMGTDIQHPKLTWWIPFGWVEKLSAYADNNWWPVWLSLAVVVLASGVAALLNGQRDAGSGLLPSRAGRRAASPWLRGTTTLLMRQTRGMIIAWLIGMAVFGASYGSIFNTIGDIAKSNPMITKILGSGAIHAANLALIKNFLGLIMIVLAVVATIPAIQLVLKLAGDQRNGYLERIFAAPVSRTHLWLSYVGWSIVSACLIYGAAVLGIGMAGRSVMHQPLAWHYFMATYWGYLPAILVMIGLTTFLIGWYPKARMASWALLGYGFYALYLGRLMNLPEWAMKLSPYGWVGNVPVKAVNGSATAWLLALAVGLLVFGWLGYQQRDLA